jgi:hypothetical protein
MASWLAYIPVVKGSISSMDIETVSFKKLLLKVLILL